MSETNRVAGFQGVASGAASKHWPRIINTDLLLETHLRMRAGDQWRSLIGFRVDVWLRGVLYRSGFVDDALAGSGGLWLASEGVFLREFIDVASGYEVWISRTSGYCQDRRADPRNATANAREA